MKTKIPNVFNNPPSISDWRRCTKPTQITQQANKANMSPINSLYIPLPQEPLKPAALEITSPSLSPTSATIFKLIDWPTILVTKLLIARFTDHPILINIKIVATICSLILSFHFQNLRDSPNPPSGV